MSRSVALVHIRPHAISSSKTTPGYGVGAHLTPHRAHKSPHALGTGLGWPYHFLLSSFPETCLGVREAVCSCHLSALPPGRSGLFVQPAWVGCLARRSQPGLEFAPNPACWVLQGSEQLIMNLIRGEQKPQSDLGFSVTSSLSSDGLSTGCSRWNAKDTSCAGAAGVGEGTARGAFDLFSSLAPRVLPCLCLSLSPHPPVPSLLDSVEGLRGWQAL